MSFKERELNISSNYLGMIALLLMQRALWCLYDMATVMAILDKRQSDYFYEKSDLIFLLTFKRADLKIFWHTEQETNHSSF